MYVYIDHALTLSRRKTHYGDRVVEYLSIPSISLDAYDTEKPFLLRSSSNSEANALELLGNLEEVFPR